MKRFAFFALALALVAGSAPSVQASWSQLGYSGYQPWWNIFAKRYKGLTPEEERLQKFWHDYYNAMKNYYGALDNIDWVAYYKNHGYQINGGCGYGGRVNYAPVFVSPTMQWAVPGSAMSGPPAGGAGCLPAGYGGAMPAGYGGGMPAGFGGTMPVGYGAAPGGN